MKKGGKSDGYQRMPDGKDRKSTIGKRSPFALKNQKDAPKGQVHDTADFRQEALRRNNESVSSFGLQGSDSCKHRYQRAESCESHARQAMNNLFSIWLLPTYV